MIRLVVDANILVGESLRERGRALLMRDDLQLSITEAAWDEARHEVTQRLHRRVTSGSLHSDLANALRADFEQLVLRWVPVIRAELYTGGEVRARRRIPRDPTDWPTVAAALTFDAGIWTQDGDFLGCGCATWTTDTLLAELNA